MAEDKVLFFKNKKGTIALLVTFLLLCGVAIRLIDFSDMPLDFASTRQFHSLIMTRGLYYQMDSPATLSMPQDIREFGINAGKAEPVIEPPILENLVAFTYRLIGGENIFVGRVYSILFWVIGGIPLFLLARRMMHVNGALAALAFYLFTPFGAIASRSFQPDPMMIMFMLWALYFQIRWVNLDTLKNSILAGLFTGIAILVKAPMIFFTGIPLAALVLQKGIKTWIRNRHIYLMAALALLPALIYNVLASTVGGHAGSIFEARFFPRLLLDIQWYLDWLQMIKGVIGQFVFILALFGFFFLVKREDRFFYASLFLGYLIYGCVFTYHIYTHNYYHLPLLPIVAIGFGSFFAGTYQKLHESNKQWISNAFITGLLLFSLGLCVQRVRGILVASDYRVEEKYWADLGKQISNNASVIALTQDYGYRINYWGYIHPSLWPSSADDQIKSLQGATDPDFQQLFKELTAGKSIFLITQLGEFENQPQLKDYLFANYPYRQGDGYFIFDLDHPLMQAQ